MKYIVWVGGTIIYEDINKLEAEQLKIEDVYELLLYGLAGYDDNTNKEIEDMFVGLWGKDQIPYK